MIDEASGEPHETPLEAGFRAREREADPVAREERDADVAVGAVDDYVVQTDPEGLAEAEEQLDEWEIPNDPLDEPIDIPEGTPLVSVFTASSEMEANIVGGILQAEGIPSTIQHLGLALGGSNWTGEGAVAHLLVPENLADAALSAIADATSSPEGIGGA